MSEAIEDRLKKIEEKIEELSSRLSTLERLSKQIDELEKTGTLSMLIKSIEVLSHSFDALADTKNLRILSMLLSAVEGVARIDPSLITVLADSIGKCIAKTQIPEVMRQLKSPPEIGGLFGLLRIINDPDVKKLLGLLYMYAKLIGGCLPEELKPKVEHLEALYEARLKMLKEYQQLPG